MPGQADSRISAGCVAHSEEGTGSIPVLPVTGEDKLCLPGRFQTGGRIQSDLIQGYTSDGMKNSVLLGIHLRPAYVVRTWGKHDKWVSGPFPSQPYGTASVLPSP